MSGMDEYVLNRLQYLVENPTCACCEKQLSQTEQDNLLYAINGFAPFAPILCAECREYCLDRCCYKCLNPNKVDRAKGQCSEFSTCGLGVQIT